MATPFPFGSGNTLLASQLNAITTLPINDQTASYVALVGDVGKRIVMNVATANTVTIDNSIFAEGDTIFIANKGAGTSTVTAGAGVTINTSSSLALAQHGGGTLVALSASVFTFFSGGGANYGTATGGTALLTPPTGYSGMSFTADGSLVVTTSGLFDVCLIGGGGSGNRGGGGAGGLLVQTVYLPAGTHSVDVGAGGSAAAATGLKDGFETTIGGVIGLANIAACGGGSYASSHNTGYGNQASAATTVTAQNQSQGKNGGAGSGTNGGGGGGGAGGIGANGSGNNGGNGGTGFDITAYNSNTSLFVSGGGAGGGTGTGGTGGSSSGGNGGVNGSPAAQNGVANTGGGGGGFGQGTGPSGDGGAGAAYIRFRV